MGSERDRVISISLSEAEWQALIARHPQPVVWLREQIREDVRTPAMDATPAGWRDAPLSARAS